MTAVTARRVAGFVATCFAVLLVGAFVVQAVPGVVGADASYVVLSGSMEPTISTGDAVVVNDVDPADIEAGSVITFVRSTDSTPVTHRVVEVLDGEDGLAFRTRGDANEDPDPQPVPAESVTGEVWFVIPYVGHVVLFANTPTGFAVLVGLPVVAFAVSELYAFVSEDSGAAQSTGGADAAPTGGTSDAADDGAPTESVAADDALVITTQDLKLSSAGFGALAVYSGYVAYLDPTPVRVAVFVAAAAVVALVVAMFVVDGVPSATSPPTENGTTDGDGAIADGGDTRGGGDDGS